MDRRAVAPDPLPAVLDVLSRRFPRRRFALSGRRTSPATWETLLLADGIPVARCVRQGRFRDGSGVSRTTFAYAFGAFQEEVRGTGQGPPTPHDVLVAVERQLSRDPSYPASWTAGDDGSAELRGAAEQAAAALSSGRAVRVVPTGFPVGPAAGAKVWFHAELPGGHPYGPLVAKGRVPGDGPGYLEIRGRRTEAATTDELLALLRSLASGAEPPPREAPAP